MLRVSVVLGVAAKLSILLLKLIKLSAVFRIVAQHRHTQKLLVDVFKN